MEKTINKKLGKNNNPILIIIVGESGVGKTTFVKKMKSISNWFESSRAIVDELKKELKKVKEQGYAMDREEFKAGINCISYPIFNANKEAIAAISLTGPATRLTLDKMENDKHILINISKQISENILM